MQMLSKLAAQVSGTDAASTLQTDMLHSWWLAESHLERLSADRDIKAKVSYKQAEPDVECSSHSCHQPKCKAVTFLRGPLTCIA